MCWYCGSPITDPEPIGRSLACIDCGKDLRSCRNCRHYRPGNCAESQAEKVSDQDRSNFCDWFSLNPLFRNATEGQSKSERSASDASSSAKNAFDELFK